MEAGAPETLVSYEAPLLVGEGGAAGGAGKRGDGESKAAATHLEEVLNSILPPRMWNDSATNWMQYVSKTPSSRLDVINLQEALDEKLMERQAREMGICPVREDLYSQCFDELIRQVCINSPERGLLLLRVRDEIRMTIAAYQTLYESSIAFGMRKALMAEQKKAEMESTIKRLQGERSDLERQVEVFKAKIEQIEGREKERDALDEKKHGDEVAYLKNLNDTLKRNLESLLAAPKK
mmetsp:Transcript_5056/g.13804  ORF Transcript_5056/g.13804 Transcript_5056/m.13804 type:complete len:237 (-) Transcript_5056:164-874(-)